MDPLKQLALTQGAHFITFNDCEIALIPSYRDPQELFFGFFSWNLQDYRNVNNLLRQAAEWAQEHHYHSLLGPININTWFPYRFKIDQGTHPQDYWWEPSNPTEYPQIFLDNGFSIAQTYSTVATADLPAMAQKANQSLKRVEDQGYQVRPFDLENLDQELNSLYNISIQGFKDNFLFSPISLDHFKSLYTSGKKSVDFSYSAFISDEKQQDVAFFFVFAQDDFIVMKSTTVLPRHRGKGLSNAVLAPAFNRAIEEGKTGYISALMIDGAQSNSYSKHGHFLWEHKYALLKREIK